jgi:hypothetical protein
MVLPPRSGGRPQILQRAADAAASIHCDEEPLILDRDDGLDEVRGLFSSGT